MTSVMEWCVSENQNCAGQRLNKPFLSLDLRFEQKTCHSHGTCFSAMYGFLKSADFFI